MSLRQRKSVNRVALGSRISRSLLSAQMASSPLTANAWHSASSRLTSSLILIRNVISARAFFKISDSTSSRCEAERNLPFYLTRDIKLHEAASGFLMTSLQDGLERKMHASVIALGCVSLYNGL